MVRYALSAGKALMVFTLTGSIMMTGCSSQSKNLVPDAAGNLSALERSGEVELMQPESPVEKDALQRFIDFYAEYSTEAIRDGVRGLYADDAWFGDPFHVVEGIDEIEHYFLVMAEPVASCTFRVDSIQRSGSDYFARWTMHLESRAARGEVIEAIGLSHVRFNAEGKIVFQQDYWDTSAMFDRLPVVGYWTRLVKNRISKGLEK
jgi:hypothetical protein